MVVLDFGGAAGTHYFIAKSILSDDIALDWRVVETTQMVKQAQIQEQQEKEKQQSFASPIVSPDENLQQRS